MIDHWTLIIRMVRHAGMGRDRNISFFFFFFIVMFTSQYANGHVDGCRNWPEGRQHRSLTHPDHVTSGTKPSWTKGPS